MVGKQQQQQRRECRKFEDHFSCGVELNKKYLGEARTPELTKIITYMGAAPNTREYGML